MSRRFEKYSLFLFLYTLLVILWGAWVRISHSGDGCGESWPLCHGQVIPEASGATWVEFAHRLSSGLYGFLVLGLWIAARRIFPKGHFIRRVSTAVFVLTIIEALLGARLVLAGLVASDASVDRAITMCLHMVNSLLLSGSMVLVAFGQRFDFEWKKPVLKPCLLFVFFLLVCSAGSIASLAGTLFPSESLWQGIQKDFSADSHFLLRLRLAHPILALAFAGSLFYMISKWKEVLWLSRLRVAVTAGILFGFLTLFLLSPTWMKLGHLLLAHLIWAVLLISVFAVFWSKRETT